MIQELIATGKTVEEAVSSALDAAGITDEEISYEVLELPKKGLLGIKSSPAKVKITYSIPDPPAAPVSKESAPKLTTRTVAAAAHPVVSAGENPALAFIQTLISTLQLEAVAAATKNEEGEQRISIDGESAGILIGHHGETLDALQYLVNLAANRRGPGEDAENKKPFVKITVDIENYRAKREETLRQFAKRMAARAVKYKRPLTLEPMNPYERRIIHSEIQNIEGVSTHSIGMNNERKIVITPEHGESGQSRLRHGK